MPMFTAILPRNGNFNKSVRVAFDALENMIPNDIVTLQAETLGEVFAKLNHGSGQELEGYQGRSLSVGDVVIDGRDRAWMCDSCGWLDMYAAIERNRDLAKKAEPLTRAEREEMAKFDGRYLPSPEVEAEQVRLVEEILAEVIAEEKAAANEDEEE